jgi:hypothetical protein
MHEKHESTFPNTKTKNGKHQFVLKINNPEKASTLLKSAVICDNGEKS